VKWLKPMATREQEKLLGIREATARKYLGVSQAKDIVRKIGEGKR